MQIRRKFLMGVVAVALPIGALGITQTAAVAKKGPPNPVSCTGFSGTVTFATPISKGGTLTKSKKAAPTMVSGAPFTCTGGTSPTGGSGNDGSGLSIKGTVNSPNPSYSKSACKASPSNTTVCDKYVTGTQAEFQATGGTLAQDIKKIKFTIAGDSAQIKVTSAHLVVGGSEGPGGCPGEVGFQLSGAVKSNDFGTTSGQVTACLGADTGTGTTGSAGVDLFLPSASVVTAQIDPATSNATL